MGPDTRAVSPVVGVALLVAIVVLLAVTAGGIFLGISVEEPAPQVATETEMEVQYDPATGSTAEYVIVGHDVGESVDPSEIRVVVAAGDERVVNPPLESGTLGAGDELRYNVTDAALCTVDADAVIVILYHEPSNKPFAEQRIRIEHGGSYTADSSVRRGKTLVCG